MKLLFAGLLAWFGLMSISSCTKDFSCECTFQDTTKNFIINIAKVHKSEAQVVCSDYDQFVGDCKIK